jgi:DNA helicase-2/ATP-dependent DNA helicase PcrA
VATDPSAALLRGLTPSQRAAVCSEAAPLCVLAGAGSGKTRVLTRRLARRLFDGSASAEHTLVLTFTRKASRELRQRLWHLDVPGRPWAGTFHAAAYAQLRRHWADAGLRPPAVLDDPRRLLRRLLDRPGTVTSEAVTSDAITSEAVASEAVTSEAVGGILAEIQWAQARLLTPATYPAAARAAGRRTPLPPDEVAALYGRYEEAKRRHGLIDLNDLLTRGAELMERDTAVAAAARWRIRHLFVDEFQDVNPAQWRLLRAWLGERTDLFVVGDPRQAVYGWNGADPSLLDRLPELLPGTAVLRLDANHRSSPQVIAAARAVLDPTAGDGPTDDGGGRPDGPAPTVTGYDDDGAEAEAVARWLRRMHRPGRPWSHLAVLARTNARLAPMASALGRAGIPFRTGPAPGATARRELVAHLRAGPTTRTLRSALADLSIPGIPPALARLADEHAIEEPGSTVGAFLAWLAATVGDAAPSEADADADAVELSTFHRAKGLEWPVVALIGLEDGLVPISYATTPPARAEERRLLYVAITRAEEELWCSWAGLRQTAGRSWHCRPSPFLAPIDASAQAAAAFSADRQTVAGQIASLRLLLPAAG